MVFVKQRLLWIGIVVVFVVIMIFGLAMMGSALGAKPKDLPVALVVLDQGADLPNGGKLAIGETITSKLLELEDLPVAWEVLDSEEEARKGLDDQSYYGALIIPSDLSSGVLSLQTPDPKPGTVKILVNEGMNVQAAAAVKQILGQVASGVKRELTKQALTMIGQQTQQLPVRAAEALLAPFDVEELIVHPVGENNANGSAPNMLTQIMWLGSMVASIFLFLAAGKEKEKGYGSWAVVSSQTAAGLLTVFAASGFLMWMASSWYGMEIDGLTEAWLFLWLAGTAFFLLQSSLLNWIGFPAVALLVLLLFFSMPVINMAPEFLTETTRDWLYSWTPFRFVTEGLRSIMYFGGTDVAAASYSVLWWLAGTCFVLLLASGVRKKAAAVKAVSQ
ncbi:YhgE/Pip domain-containing protein [Paenibacillus alkalitolerans]|uniref:YhgE/Pip domain-containing protein n=1 Tax=Paenibacillus alkalitolerans TaxID=2799335 RepID=UPI0018F4CF03|nr:ABC transporter permease [Paenibacillus alkalitolerans]